MREGQLAAIGLGPLLGVVDLSGDGLCELIQGPINRAFAFKDRRVVRYVTSVPGERLGRHAVSLGLVAESTVERALASRRAGEPVGQALVRLKMLDPMHLDWLLSFQAAEGILDAVTWKDGTYRITSTEVLNRPLDLPSGPGLHDLAADASGRALVWKDLQARVPGILEPLERTSGTAGAVDMADARLLSVVDSGRGAAAAAAELNQPLFHVVLGLARLVHAGLVRPRVRGAVAWKPPVPSSPGQSNTSRLVRLRQLVAERDVAMAYAEARALLKEDPTNAEALAALRAAEVMSLHVATRESSLGEMLARLRESGVLPLPGKDRTKAATAAQPEPQPVMEVPPLTAPAHSWDIAPTTAVATPAGMRKKLEAGFSPDAVATLDRIPLVAVPRLTARASNLDGLGFTPLESAQLTAVDGRRSVAELARHLHVDATQLADLILRARDAGAVTV